METIGKKLRSACYFPGCQNRYISVKGYKNKRFFPGCQNRYISVKGYKNKRFFRFPTDETSRASWLKICEVDQKHFFKDMLMCEDHFVPQDYVNFHMERLKYLAVPKNLSLEKDTSTPISQPDDVTDYPTDHNYTNTPIIYSQDKFSFLLEDNRSFRCKTGSKSADILIHRSALAKMMTLKNALGVEDNHMEKIKELYEDGKFKNIEEELCTLPKGLIDSHLKIARHLRQPSSGSHLKIVYRRNGQPSSVKQWSLDDEILALWLYIRIPCLYKYMSKILQFPSEHRLEYLLSRIPFGTDVNRIVMESLKIKSELLSAHDRNCSLLFGEIKLSKGLDYDQYQQFIYGFEDIGQLGTTNEEADCALVFMIKGIKMSWEQVLAYYFLSEPIQSSLQIILVKIIKELQKIGFNIVATVCDSKQIYVESLKLLCGEETFFQVNSAPVYTFFDVPHLLKDTRDALLHCNIEFEKGKTAKFAYIEQAFNLDREKRTFSQLSNLKPEHFQFENDHIRNNLSIAAAQLSHSMACSIESWICCEQLSADAIHTAEFVSYVETILNSLTVLERDSPKRRQYMCAVSSTRRIALWSEALKMISNWQFLHSTTNEDVATEYSLVLGWKNSIISIMCLWNELRPVGFKYLSLKAFNTDSLNSFLDAIREHHALPSCHQFVAAFKTNIIQNFSVIINKSNERKCTPLVKPRNFLRDAGPIPKTYKVFLTIDKDLATMDEYEATAYVAGYILKQIKCHTKCKVCVTDIFSIDLLSNEANVDLTLSASEVVIKFVDTIKHLLYAFLNSYVNLQLPLEDTFKMTYKSELNIKFCPQHENFIRDQSIRIFIYEWVRQKKK